MTDATERAFVDLLARFRTMLRGIELPYGIPHEDGDFYVEDFTDPILKWLENCVPFFVALTTTWGIPLVVKSPSAFDDFDRALGGVDVWLDAVELASSCAQNQQPSSHQQEVLVEQIVNSIDKFRVVIHSAPKFLCSNTQSEARVAPDVIASVASLVGEQNHISVELQQWLHDCAQHLEKLAEQAGFLPVVALPQVTVYAPARYVGALETWVIGLQNMVTCTSEVA